MKIKYNLNDKYFKYYNQVNGIYLLRKKLKKDHDLNLKGYVSYMTQKFIKYIVIIIILKLICLTSRLPSIAIILQELIYLIFLLYVAMIIPFLGCIIDKSIDGFQIGFSYEMLEIIVITNDLVIFFFPKYRFTIFINNKDFNLEEMLTKIKEFSDVPIINKMESEEISS